MPYKKVNYINALLIGGNDLVVHAAGTWFDSVQSGKFDFFQKLERKITAEGKSIYLVNAASRKSKYILTKPALHLHLGRRKLNASRVLYVMPSYIWGFWYIDSCGINWNSSLASKPFHPEKINSSTAKYFFDGVSAYMLKNNISKYPQKELLSGNSVEPAEAVIFLQEIDKYKNPVHYLDSMTIIRTVATSIVGKVYVKFHPEQNDITLSNLMDFCGKYGNVTISDGSIHQLTKCSEIVITQNSAAGFEALLQKKPIITCAKSDYHHATVVAKTESELIDALRNVHFSMVDFCYEKYIYWFLGVNMHEPAKGNFETGVWDLISKS